MSGKQGRILIVDDDEDVLLAARLALKQQVSEVHTQSDPNVLPSLLKKETYDVILLDMNFTRDVTSGSEGFHWLGRALESDPSAVVILMTAFAEVDLAVRAIKAGAVDFVVKPWQNEKLLATVFSALALSRSRREVESLRSRQEQLSADLDLPFQEFVGKSPAIQEVFAVIRKVGPTDANVLITGENGTGKELVARAIHRESPRRDGVFVKVDMGSLSPTLFESELFGHDKGAFTDARQDRPGRFELASGGSLFLDEIGNLPLELQPKLLSVIQNRQVTRVGSNATRDVDIRLISATNASVQEMVREGQFREDLLYRINTVEIRVPPLRERSGDIPLLLAHFLKTACTKYRKPALQLNPSSLSKLELYDWPGNVRELQHTVERAVILAEGEELQISDFLFPAAEATGGELTFESYNLEEVERVVIRKALAKHTGNVSHAARELGLTRAALYRRLERYGL